MRWAGKYAFAGAFLLLLLALLPACREEEAKAEPQERAVICTGCRATGMVNVPAEATNDFWPRECGQCRKTSAYPFIQCARCGKSVPLRSDSGTGFGYPSVCPHCRRHWEH